MRFFWTITILLTSLMCNTLFAQADFYTNETDGCTPHQVKFHLDLTTVSLDTVQSVEWDLFGDGTLITSNDPDTVSYDRPGSYSVLCLITTNSNEVIPIEKTDYIEVHQKVRTDFEFERFDNGYTYVFTPSDPIIESGLSFYYSWAYRDLIDNSPIREQTFTITIDNQELAIDTITFPDTGNYSAQLMIESAYCLDRSNPVRIVVRDEILIPNIFFPDEFTHYIIDPNDPGVLLSFQLFSRNGVLIFTQEAPIINWDGRTNSGQELNTGVYYYVLEATQGDPDKLYTKHGFIHVFRQ